MARGEKKEQNKNQRHRISSTCGDCTSTDLHWNIEDRPLSWYSITTCCDRVERKKRKVFFISPAFFLVWQTDKANGFDAGHGPTHYYLVPYFATLFEFVVGVSLEDFSFPLFLRCTTCSLEPLDTYDDGSRQTSLPSCLPPTPPPPVCCCCRAVVSV